MNAPVVSVASYRTGDHSALQAQLTVDQIMTPRDAFLCALEGQTVAEAFQHVPEVYDALPVIEGNDPRDPAAEVIGIIDCREVAPAEMRQSVSTHMQERHCVGIRSTLPLLEFAASGRVDELTFVTADERSIVCGLVTVHDLQRLPVRIALFAALTDLEEDIAGLLDLAAPDPAKWHTLVHDPRGIIKIEIEKGLKRAARRDDLGSPILTLSFGIKLALLEGLKNSGQLAGVAIPNLRNIRDARNDIAHGIPFERIEIVPKAARDLRNLHSSVKTLIARHQ
ncbi:hypothetical protein [Marivita sp. GX14005]|uniref:hypothetical protein n=1 Tax=Marivita sp. GX14005 TaxID=2942276 RepID=UPI002019816D|nr:hypothetical protein [Marivita sp. GX14005]MCL3881031.1 hypothetical protein [Marivita sp. GX14005]